MSRPKLLLLTLPVALLAAATPPAGSRLAAMQAAYDEGRWVGGADDAACSSGWSDVPTGQGRAAAARLVWLVRQFRIRSYLDVPFGDLCFTRTALRWLRASMKVC